ncbi:retrovirus-related pol polyprotein from transposon TNT 1-94 [Tanacetum coccineum]|uniref:Retrovirus-related pol polyprotein from transposon TNT 1-94 n=1 Tax=Tanacetum coccineum TaxID=301880 RepID=A0ABQ5D4U2_9ASTR
MRNVTGGATAHPGVWSKLSLYNGKVKFEDEDLALLLLTFLPASYEHSVDTLLLEGKLYFLILKDVMATLNLKKIKERSKAVKGDDGEGLYVRGRTDRRDSRQSKGKSRSKSQGIEELKCYYLPNYEDHLKRNCPKNNCTKSTGYIKKDDQPNSNGSIYDGFEVMMVMSAEALLDWIMDSGGSYHMTHMLDILFDFLECDGSSVLLGDNRECKIRGIGKELLKRGIYRKIEVEQTQDLWGPSQVKSLEGKRYFLSIVDDYSRRVWVYILRFKHEAFEKFKEWKQLAENQTGRTVKKLKTDNGLEFCNQEFEQLCVESGIASGFLIQGF